MGMSYYYTFRYTLLGIHMSYVDIIHRDDESQDTICYYRIRTPYSRTLDAIREALKIVESRVNTDNYLIEGEQQDG